MAKATKDEATKVQNVNVSLEDLDKYARATEVKAPEVKDDVPAKPLLLRTVKAERWKELFQLYVDGITLPKPIIGVYRDEAENAFHIVVDGMHRITALQHMAGLLDSFEDGTISPDDKTYMESLTDEERERMASLIEEIPVQLITYDSLGDALIDQLEHNSGGSKVATEFERDARIKYLVNVLGVPLKEVAAKVHLSESSISRISQGKQNFSGTSKGGRGRGTRNKGAVIMKAPAFFKALASLTVTAQNEDARRALNGHVTTQAHFDTMRQAIEAITEVADWIEADRKPKAKEAKKEAA